MIEIILWLYVCAGFCVSGFFAGIEFKRTRKVAVTWDQVTQGVFWPAVLFHAWVDNLFEDDKP